MLAFKTCTKTRLHCYNSNASGLRGKLRACMEEGLGLILPVPRLMGPPLSVVDALLCVGLLLYLNQYMNAANEKRKRLTTIALDAYVAVQPEHALDDDCCERAEVIIAVGMGALDTVGWDGFNMGKFGTTTDGEFVEDNKRNVGLLVLSKTVV